IGGVAQGRSYRTNPPANTTTARGLAFPGVASEASPAVFALRLGVCACGRAVEDAVAAMPVFVAALLVDEVLVAAVLIAANEVVGVLDDVVEELECADGVELARDWSACRGDSEYTLPRWEIGERPCRQCWLPVEHDVGAEGMQEGAREHRREQEEGESVFAEKRRVRLLRRHPLNSP